MPRAFVALGSNVDPAANIPKALELLGRRVRILRVSSFRRTAPVGPPGQPPFVNGVAEVETGLPPRALKCGALRSVERALGRDRRRGRYSPRPIDLDLVLYGKAVVNEPGLVLPDPDLRTRGFLARGVLELAPGLRLPDTGEALESALSVDAAPEGRVLRELSRRLKRRYEGHEQDPRPRARPGAPRRARRGS